MNEQEVEQSLEDRGLNHPRVKPQDIDSEILDVKYHVFQGTTTTVCLITLRNGFTVVGHSACASGDNFKEDIGRSVAFRNAREQIWPLLGFRLRDELARPRLTDADALADLNGTPRPDCRA